MSVLEIGAQLKRGAFMLNAKTSAPLDGVTVIFGPSGAGKSLLLSAIAGLARIEAGKIVLADRVLDAPSERVRVPPHERGVGMVFQDARLFPHLSVRGNLAYAERRAPAHKTRLSLAEAAKEFDIADLLERRVRNLSGGEQGRVALARAILSAPDLLLLDEPFAALDRPRRRAFLSSLRGIHERHALPMIVVTHQIDDAASIADHVIGLRGGSVVAAGAIAQTVATEAFQSLLDPHDVGAAVPLDALASRAQRRERAAWVRADHVLLARVRPEGISARNIWEAKVSSIKHEADGAILVGVETKFGPISARITSEAAQELELAPGKSLWAIVKAHAV
ncbi:MAG: ATP-binding cassette domain-containing protein [Caulobacterales bacterium]